MPGLLTFRPLTSAARAAKTASAKNAVSAAKAEKARDDRTHGQGTTFARALQRSAPPPPRVPAALQPARPKQVTDALGGEKLLGNASDNFQRLGIKDYCSSGSEHEPNSVCLAEMVFDYIEDDFHVGKCGRARCNCANSCTGEPSLTETDDARSSLGGEMADILLGLVSCTSTSERTLLSAVNKAWEDESGSDTGKKFVNGSLLRRGLMTALRSFGYNAAICKSRWEHAGGFPGGDYEYIDVLFEGNGLKGERPGERVLVDVDFKTQFEIARPTSQYSVLLQLLPSIYVGKADRLQQIVSLMCDAAKRSLKKSGMHLPPWRKLDYIKAKWLSSYRRTTNETSSSLNRPRDAMLSDIGRIALRGSEWDSKFTSDMEKHYHSKATDARKALRECNAELSSRGKSMLQKRYGDESDVNKARDKGHGDESDASRARGKGCLVLGDVGKDITATTTEWEPPKVIPRTNPRAAGKVTGLVSILMEAGLSEEIRKDLGESQRQQSNTSALATS